MPRLNCAHWSLAATVGIALGSASCSSSIEPADGACVTDTAVDCNVSFALLGNEPQSVGLIGYSCAGTARPDDDAHYRDGVPDGKVCASRGTTVDGRQKYCCSAESTTCAYNPVSNCGAGDNFQCRGPSRPEALNPALECGNGVYQDQYIDYCCSGQAPPAECTQVNTIGCSERLTGYSCPGTELPKAEQLGASESRADFFRPLCPTPTPSANVTRFNYCCFMPALLQPGASCVQHTTVPGCAAGRFGFACYGRDTPDQDYAPMNCPDPGVPGTSAEGYPATLYCCDFK